MKKMSLKWGAAVLVLLLGGCATQQPVPLVVPPSIPASVPAVAAPVAKVPPRIGLALGGGAARGLSGHSNYGYLSGNGLLSATAFGRLAGISAAPVSDKEQAVGQLSRQMAEKIRWLACMDACAEAGITYALELGPGSALTKMLQARHPHINTRSVADFRTLDGIRKWLDRAAD